MKPLPALVASVLALLSISSGRNLAAFAQPLTLEEADKIALEAEVLLQNQADLITTAAALERALTAYNKLDDLTGRIEVLERLVHIHERACQLDEATVWANEQLSLLTTEDEIRSFEVVGWSKKLGELLIAIGQADQLANIYTIAERYLIQRQGSISYLGDRLAASWLWGAQADLVSDHLSLLPAGSADVPSLAKRLIMLREQVAGIERANSLYEDTIFINQPSIEIDILTESARFSRQYGYDYGEMRAFTILSDLAFQSGDYAQAIEHAQRARTISEQMHGGNSVRIATSYLLAKSEQAQGNQERAMAHYNDILTFQDAQNQTSISAWTVKFFQREIIDELVSLNYEVGQPEMAVRLEAKYAIETEPRPDEGSIPLFTLPPQDPYRQHSRHPVISIRRPSPFASSISPRSFSLAQMCPGSETEPSSPFGLPPIILEPGKQP